MGEQLSEKAFKHLFESLITAVELIDSSSGRIVLANQAAARMFGFNSPDEMIGENPLDYLHPEDRERTARAIANGLFEKDLRETGEARAFKKDGTEIWVSATGARIEYEGKIMGLVSMTDITREKAAEKALKEAEDRYWDVINNASESIFITQDWKIVFANRRGAELAGLSQKELVGLPILEITHPDDRKNVADRYQRIMDGMWSATAFTVRGLDSAGRTRWAEIREMPCAWNNRPAVMSFITDITEQKLAEEALQESERKYRMLVENCTEVIFSLDTEGNFTYISPAIERLSGYRDDEVVGTSFTRYVVPEDLPALMESFKRTLSGILEPAEFRAVRKDGAVRHVRTSCKLIMQGDRVVGLTGIMTDITDIKLAHEALRASEQHYRLLADNILDLLWLTDLNLKTIYVSPSVTRLLGYSVEEVLSGRVETILTPESLNRAMEFFRTVFAREKTHPGIASTPRVAEFEHIRKDGSRFWAEVTLNLVRDQQGRPQAILGVTRDISDRKAAEQKLRESEEKYRTLAEESLQGITIIQGSPPRIVYCNTAFAKMTGYTVEELLSMSSEQLVNIAHPDDRRMMLKRHSDRLRGLPVESRYEFKAVHKDGSTIWLEYSVSMIQYKGQAAVMATFIDTTERKKAELALQEITRQWQRTFDASTDAIFLLDTDQRILRCNHTTTMTFGISPEEVIGRHCWEIVHHTKEPIPPCPIIRIRSSFSREDMELQSGDRWFHVTVDPILDEARALQGFVHVIRDITSRKQMEETLRASEERNRLLVENANEAIVVIQDGVLKFVNPKFAELTGFTTEEVVSRKFADFIHPDDKQMVADYHARRTKGEDVPHIYQFRFHDREGHIRWAEANAVLIEWEGRPASLVMLNDITDRKKAEIALKDSEEKFRTLIEKSSDAIIVADASGRITYASPSMEQVVGYRPEEWLNRPITEWLLHPDDRPLIPAVIDRLKKQPDVTERNITVRYRHRDGSWHHIEATVRNLLHDPRINGIVVNFRDVTERVIAEEAVRESEKRYRLFADNVWDVLWITDLNLRPLYISPSIERFLGYSVEESLASSFEKMLTPESARQAAESLAKTVSAIKREPAKKLKPQEIELEFRRKDGLVVWAHTTVNMVCDAAGNPIEIVGVLRDITDRKKAETALKESQERFRALCEATVDLVWEINTEARYTYISPRVLDILGYHSEEILNRPFFDLMPPREARRVARVFEQHMNNRRVIALLENVCLHKNGRPVIMETSAVPIMNGLGTLRGYRGISRDITERKKAAKQLQQSYRRLERVMESTIQAITTTMETRDPYTTGHQRRVTDLACAIAREMRLPSSRIDGLRVAGLVHDIGKISVPAEILSKPGKLNEVEFNMIRTHPEVGYNILKNVEFPWPVAQIVLQHHERMDGSGYPKKIKGEDILLEARILAVADVVEAISSHRPYRAALGIDKAIAELSSENAARLYDPAVVRACKKVILEEGFQFQPLISPVEAR